MSVQDANPCESLHCVGRWTVIGQWPGPACAGWGQPGVRMGSEPATIAPDGTPGGSSHQDSGGVPTHEWSAVRVTTDLAPAEILRKLDGAARRGRLPGFRPGPDPCLFTVAAFGTPFDAEMHASASSTSGRTTLTFRVRMQRRGPGIFLTLCVLAVWPGVWVTDSMLRSYIPSYQFPTWIWYLPITIVPLPFAWRRAMRRSRAEIAESTRLQIEQIAKDLAGRMETPGSA